MQVYKDIQYRLSKSNRKTASIYIERDGSISVIVPQHFTQKQIESVLEKKRRWIYTNLAKWEELNATGVSREFVNGEGFLYLGRSYRLQLVPKQEVPLLLKQGYFCMNTKQGGKTGVNPADVFVEFYKQKGKQRIPERIALYQKRLGVQTRGIRMLDLKNRWASCSANGMLNFHWKCMMAPLTILDYIVVHELVHLIHPHHTDAFWNTVDKILPDYLERQEWLKMYGAGLGI